MIALLSSSLVQFHTTGYVCTLQINPLSDAFYSTSSLATSFMKSREAGVVLSSACSGSINFYPSVFESDWNEGL